MPSRLPPSAVVVVPAHNAAATLDRTLQSAVTSAQYCADQGLAMEIDIAVVDDMSTDATPEIVTAWSKKSPLVRLIRAPQNGGPGRARNIGVVQSSGKFLFFLDADDVFYPNHIHVCAAALIADDSIGYVFTRMHVDMPMHPDWRRSLDESNPINFCVRRVWHDMIEGFAEGSDFRQYRTEDTLYRKCLRELVQHKKLDIETCEQFVSPGNALDRQREKFAMSMAEWRAGGGSDGFFMTEAMKEEALRRLAHVQKLRTR